jgi:HSP20 family protein
MDQLFERWLGNGLAPLGDSSRWGLEIQDEPEAYVVTAEAPGFEVGDFDIQVSDSRLTLRAERKSETKDRDGKRVERVERHLAHTLALPDGIDADKVEAKYVNGMLTITVPKSKTARGRKVTVKS